MAANDHYSSSTPTTSTASSAEPSSHGTHPQTRLLQALCVFQHLSNPEVLKSVQLYSENGSMSAIQQELTFSPNAYAQISDPIPSYFSSKYSAIDSEDFFTTLKKINEIDMWTCIFEYHKHRVPASIPHLLSVSNNPLLQSLPCLAYDLMLVEKDVHSRRCDAAQLVLPLNCVAQEHHFQGKPLPSPTKWGLSAMPDLTPQSESRGENAGTEMNPAPALEDGGAGAGEGMVDHHGHEMEMQQVETNLHEWGSDLELASPRVFHPCQLGSSWSTSTVSMVPFAGALSPTCSMVSSQKGGGLDPSWTSPAFIARSNVCDGFPLDSSPSFAAHASLGHLKPPANSNDDFPHSTSPVSPGSLFECSVNSALGSKQQVVRQLNGGGHLRRVVERSPSHCSDESVGTPLKRAVQEETLGSVALSLQPLATSGKENVSIIRDEGLMYRDLGLAVYPLDGATAAAACSNPRGFSGLQHDEFPACASDTFMASKNGRFSSAQSQDLSGNRVDMFPGAPPMDSFGGGCQSDTFSGFQSESSLYVPESQPDIFWNDNYLRDGRNDVGYLNEARNGARNEGLPSMDDDFSLHSARAREVNYLGQASELGYVLNDPTADNVSTRNMLEKVSGHMQSHQRGPSERMTDITLAELSHYFNMPITQASKELKVGLTVLKKRCREFGIPRWPHRKMKSLDSLIHNIQELAKGPDGQTSLPVLNAVRELENQKKTMEERPGIELAERTKRLRQACFKASYKRRRQAQLEAGTLQGRQFTDGSSVSYQAIPLPGGLNSGGSVDQCGSTNMTYGLPSVQTTRVRARAAGGVLMSDHNL